MLQMLRDLVVHKGTANAALLHAIRQHDAAASDRELSELLHHILVANRFWLLTVLGSPFDVAHESRICASFEDLVNRYEAIGEQESAWLESATDADLARKLEHPLIPGGTCSVAQAIVQVCMHSHGHRAQCAKRLRQLGGVPPPTDFILWLAAQPRPQAI